MNTTLDCAHTWSYALQVAGRGLKANHANGQWSLEWVRLRVNLSLQLRYLSLLHFNLDLPEPDPQDCMHE